MTAPAAELLADRLAAMRADLAAVLVEPGRVLRDAPTGDRAADWLELLPLPLTVGDALDALDKHGADLVAEVAAEVVAACDAFDLAEVAATMAAFWPWPNVRAAPTFARTDRALPAEAHAAACALRELRGAAGDALADNGRWPMRPDWRLLVPELDALADRLDAVLPVKPNPDDDDGEPAPGRPHGRWVRAAAARLAVGEPPSLPSFAVPWGELGWPHLAALAVGRSMARDPAGLADATATAWRQRRDPGPEHLLTAAAVLRAEGVPDDDARRRLAAELADELRAAGDAVADGADAVAEVARRLGATGNVGASLAARVDAWRVACAWQPGYGAATLVAAALWTDRVAAAVAAAAKRAATHRPALVRAVVADLMVPVMTRQLDMLDGSDVLRDKRGREVGRVALVDGASIEGVRRGLDRLGSVYGHRLIRKLVLQAHAQAEAGDGDARRVAFEGGWSALADALGHNRDFAALRDLLEAGASVRWDTPAAKGAGWWTFTERRGSRAGPGEIAFIVGEVLAPHHAMALAEHGADSLPARIARRLVPELRSEPPVSALRSNDHGAAWNLHRLLLVELVDHAEPLHLKGAVPIAGRRWAELAKQAGVPAGNLPKLLDSWRTGDAVAPPLVAELEAGAFTLADAHKPERDFIADGGRRRYEGRLNGRAGMAKKGRQRSKQGGQGKP